MAEHSLKFCDLALDIIKTVFDHVMETVGLHDVVRMRLVCSKSFPDVWGCMIDIVTELFSREILGAVYRSGALELPEYRNTTGSPSYEELVQDYLLYRVFADGKRKQNLSKRLHRILEIILPLEDYHSQKYQNSVRALIDALVGADGHCSRGLTLIRCSNEPTLLESTLNRDCLRAGAVLGISRMFGDIVSDASVNRIPYGIDYSSAFGETSLIYATIGHHFELVRSILNGYAKSGRENDGWEIRFALREATKRGHESMALLLIKAYPGDLTRLHDIPWHAAATNQVSLFKLLCEQLHAPLYDFRSIREAVRYGHKDFVELCLDNGTDINANASPLDDMWELESPLYMASSRGYRDIVQLLLSHGATATDYIDNFSSLTIAASHGHCEIVLDLLAAGSVPVHHQKFSPLTSAVRNNQFRTVEVLLDSGVELWYKDRALSLAAAGGYGSLVKLLVQRGAKIDGTMGPLGGYIPILEAHAYGHIHIVKLLLELGAEPIDPLKSHYAKYIERGMWPFKPLFGLMSMKITKH